MSVRDTIYDWVLATSGLAPGNVIWSLPPGPRPTTTYIALSIDEGDTITDWLVQSDAPSPVPGADLKFTLTGPEVSTLKLECFAGTDKWEVANPEARLRAVVSGRNLPLQSHALRKGGVGFGRPGPIGTLRLDRAQVFEPRAQVLIPLHTISEVSELGTWIERAEVQVTIDKDKPTEIVLPPFVTPEP